MNLSIIDLRLIIQALEELKNNMPCDLEFQRVKKGHAENLIRLCNNKIGDIEVMAIE